MVGILQKVRQQASFTCDMWPSDMVQHIVTDTPRIQMVDITAIWHICLQIYNVFHVMRVIFFPWTSVHTILRCHARMQ